MKILKNEIELKKSCTGLFPIPDHTCFHTPLPLMTFIETIENALGKKSREALFTYARW